MSTPEGSQDIHDLIQQARLELSVGAIDDLLTIVTALHKRINDLERDQIGMAGRIGELEKALNKRIDAVWLMARD